MNTDTLIDILDKCNSILPSAQNVYLGSKDVCGQFFFTLTSGGIKEEAQRFPALYAGLDQACREFLRQFSELAIGKRRVHWRWLPSEVAIACGDDGTRYCIIARLSFE